MTRTASHRKLDSKLAGALVIGASLLASAPVWADAAAPAWVQDNYGLSCTPQCTLCHGSNLGGFGNFRTITVNGQSKGGFILTIKACGFVPTDQNTWKPAFDQCELNKTDTDGDGTPDIAELKEGRDPNDPNPTAILCGGDQGPTYGCVHVARKGSVDGLGLLAGGAVLFAGIALSRRRRSR